MKNTDTIAAIATAMSGSGIGIIRISGPEAYSIIEKIFRKKNGKPIDLSRSHVVQYGYICDGDENIDEVLVLLMKGPHSYTAEDTVEIDCHGGVLMMKTILETVIKYGARPAEPGEFTKRAFLNGRLDLSQAEAVIGVINAQNHFAMKSSMDQLRGSVSREIKGLREEIIHQIAFIESALDDPEHISLDGYDKTLFQVVKSVEERLHRLIRTADQGKIISEGIRTAIVGKPNAGKSSLMNALLGEERAIVTDIAGTTRDTLEEQVRLGELSLRMIDTAGIRETEDVVEQIGVSRARKAADEADLIIYVVDGSVAMDDNDRQIMEMIRDRKAVVLLNKSDLSMVIKKEELEALVDKPVILCSAREEQGLEELEKLLMELFSQELLSFNDEVTITNVRHKTALSESLKSMEMVEESIKNQMPEDFYSIDLMNAYEQLGLIVGEAVEDDLVNEIFSKFCTGK